MHSRRSSGHILEPSPVHHHWLTTFNDLITLMMVFFVLLFSMGHMDTRRFSSFQNALQSAMGVLDAGRLGDQGLISEDPTAAGTGAAADMNSLRQLPNTSGLEAEYTSKGIKLTLNEELLFASASAEISGPGADLLQTIGAVVEPMRRPIRIEGHTDDRPIATGRYPSNWELSVDRAVRVVKFLAERCGIEPSRLSAAGYGAFKPKVDNQSDASRAVNRRVEIFLGREFSSGSNH